MTTCFTGFDGIHLAADVLGDPANPGILLLPNFGQTRAAWSRAAKALVAAGRYVVSIDLRGHGESDWAADKTYRLDDFVRDVEAVASQMPSPPAIVGAGMGGLAALAAISDAKGEQRSMATALVLVDAAPRMAREAVDRIAALMTIDAEGFSSVEEAASVIASHLISRVKPNPLDLRTHLRRADDGRFRWHVDPACSSFGADVCTRRAAKDRFTSAASQVRVPTFVVRGEASAMIDQDSITAFRDLIPHAEFADIAGAGDTLLGDRNDAFDATILEFLERVVPRNGSHPQGGIEPRMLRNALGCFATGVTVITTTEPNGQPLGFTANSFTSVSLDPPMVLFCIKRESASVEALRQRGAFAVNILHIGQQAISARFASRVPDRFADVPCETWGQGVPILQDAMANFECCIDEMHEGGDHLIVLGRVTRVHFDPARDPLLFLQGKYRRVHVAREETA